MAITTLAGIKAGLLPPVVYSWSYTPISSAHRLSVIDNLYDAFDDTTTANGIVINEYTDVDSVLMKNYEHPLPASGNSLYLAGVTARGAHGLNDPIPVHAVLMDMLWYTGADSSGTALPLTAGTYTINSAQWPARDNNGTSNGDNVYVGLLNHMYLNGGNLEGATISYTNSAGTSGRTGTLDYGNNASNTNNLIFFSLQAGDFGVRSVQSLTVPSNSITAGAYRLLAVRPFFNFRVNSGARGRTIENAAATMAMPIPDGAVVAPFTFSGSDTTACGLLVHYAQG